MESSSGRSLKFEIMLIHPYTKVGTKFTTLESNSLGVRSKYTMCKLTLNLNEITRSLRRRLKGSTPLANLKLKVL